MLEAVQETIVRGAGVDLATRDHGGAPDGPEVLLVHGAGRTLEDFGPMIPHLLPDHRVVALDLRCHGRSGDGAWDWDQVLADIDAVARTHGLTRPAIVGHSLGGMIGALYAAEREACLAAVNLDGHGSGRPEQYAGLEPEYVTRRLGELKTLSLGSAPPGPLGEEQLAQLRAVMAAQLEARGLPSALAGATIERSLQRLDGGQYQLRPTAAAVAALVGLLEELDLFAIYRRVRRPLLVYNAIAPDPAVAALGVDWLPELMAAYRQGLARDLAALAAATPAVSVETIDASHGLIFERPAEIAARVRTFLAAA